MPLLPILHLELNGPGAAAAARSAPRGFLEPSDAGDRACRPVARDTAVLVISELVTNAVRHAGPVPRCRAALPVRASTRTG